MRAVVALCVVLASATALAKPRVQVAPFSVHGDSLGYFGPEVARAVTAALEGDGVETGPGGADTISGRVDELPGERVRLSATLQKRTLTAEGPLEAIDAVATQLANKLAPLLLENDPAAQKLAEKRARDAEKRAASVPPSRPAPKLARVEPARSVPARAEEPKSEAKPAAAAEKAPPVEEAKPEAKPTEEAKGEPKPSEAPKANETPKAPEWTPPRVDSPPPRTEPAPPVAAPPAPPMPPPYYGGYVRGRVVAHAVADPHPSYAAAGVMATQALFSFLQRRLRLSVIPTGVGITSTSVAADEAYRAAARAVVMARLESVEFVPGPAARVRLEVVVVRDGRPVMRRVVESAPSDPNRRGAATDPVYQAVTMALEALVPELVGALADVR
ncbi:MAG TPA: hypothetical protein VF997_01745 [Polyangia bacterium]